MKKLFCVILTLVLLVSCSFATASGMSDRYDEALELIMKKQYLEAAAILDEISIFNDASQLSIYCKSIAGGSEGNYAVAYNMLDALGEYKDSKLWSIYFKACEAQEKGDDMLAYELFSSISLFQDASNRMQGVQTGKNSEFKKEYSLDCRSIGEGLIVIKKDDKCGYADIHGNIVLEPYWEDADPFENGNAIVKSGFGTSYVIDHSGKNIIGCYYHGYMRDGTYFITMDYDYKASKVIEGLIDDKGTLILEAKYDAVDVLTSSCVAVEKDEKYGLFNMQGKQILEFQYDRFRSISNSLISVKKDDKYALLNGEGKEISEFIYDDVGYENQGLVSVKADGKYGFVNLEGEVVIDLKYDKVWSFSENGLAEAQLGDYVGYIDIKGNDVIPLEYETLGSVKDGKVRAQKDGKWGWIDINNAILIPFEFEELWEFGEGVAASKKDGKFGYIDEKGNPVLVFKWETAGTFSEGKAFVSDESGQYCIDSKGEKLFDVPIPGVHYMMFNKGVSIISQESEEKNEYGWTDKKYGLINSAGEVLIAPEYDSIYLTNENFYSIRKGGWSDGKEGLVSVTGEIVLEPKYDSISSFTDEGYALVIGESTWFIIDSTGAVVF